MQSSKLDVKAFGLTAGLLWGIGLFCLTWWIILFDGPTKDRTFIGRLYRGYRVSPAGSFIGLLWGLADGAVGGAIFAQVYNSLTTGVNELVAGQEKGSKMTQIVTD